MEQATMHFEVRRADGDPDDVREFIGSTDAVDRAGDIVLQNFNLGPFRKNPVVPWGHQYGGLPVGRAVKVWKVRGTKPTKANDSGKKPPKGIKINGDQTRFKIQFVPRDIYPFAGTVLDMVDGGFIKATSIGFMPIESRFQTEEEREFFGTTGKFMPMIFERSELLEVSIVSVPMNQEALAASAEFLRGSEEHAKKLWEAPREIINAGVQWDEAKQFLAELHTDFSEAVETADGDLLEVRSAPGGEEAIIPLPRVEIQARAGEPTLVRLEGHGELVAALERTTSALNVLTLALEDEDTLDEADDDIPQDPDEPTEPDEPEEGDEDSEDITEDDLEEIDEALDEAEQTLTDPAEVLDELENQETT